MNESILELLQKVTLYDLIWSLLLIIAVIGILISQKKRISGWMNKWRKDKNHKEDFNNLVYELKDSLAGISKIVNDQSVEMNNLKQEINNLKQEIINVHEKDSKTKRAEIKEKIERIYGECHPAMTCTDMQFEVLKELIEEYEEHGGVNSFVHTTVEPEMHTWDKVYRIKKEVDSNECNIAGNHR